MTQIPWIKIFAADEMLETASLSTLEVGAYHLLRITWWQAGGLPDDDERLARIVRLPLSQWLEIRPAMEAMFDEGWQHGRMQELRNEAATLRKIKSEGGRKGARIRWEHGNTNGIPNGSPNGIPIRENRTANGSANRTPNANLIATSTRHSAYEEGTSTRAHARARNDASEIAYEPLPSEAEAEAFLKRRGVPDEELQTLSMKLQAWRLYPADLERFGRPAA